MLHLYNTVKDLTQSDYVEMMPFSIKQKRASRNKTTPSITNFSPTTVTAGTGTQLTINGSNFGGTAGTVGFSDANDGGASFFNVLPSQIISWNTNQIVVEVPDRAGTGIIRVTNTDPSSVNSVATLTVSYAHLNVESDNVNPGTEIAYPTQHIDDNENGGYTWQFFTDFNNNSPAKSAFLRALDSWRCTGTNINWSVGPVTTIDVVANDGVNIVRFDNGAELPAGVLGRCTSRYGACFAGGGTSLDWFVSELDIVFNDNFTWNFDMGAPGGSEFDFESVAVHELGHGHQLGHVIDTDDVMHFSLSNGEEQRTPSANNLAGGNNVMTRSTTSTVCGEGLMTSFTCGQAPVTRFSGNQTSTCGTSLNVSFADESLGIPTSWAWNFGDGTMSTAQNPSHNYTSAGSYTVTLTATNGNGSTQEVKTDYITLGGGAPTSGCTVSSTGLGGFGTGIRNFTMVNINHSTDDAEDDGGYLDFSCTQIISGIDTGQSYNFSLTVGTTNPENVRIYIDYNDNGTFDGGEEVFASTSAAMGTHTGSIAISNAASVVTGKVIRLRTVSDFSAITGGCNNVIIGQHEDYGILINSSAGNPPTADFTASSTTVCEGNTVSFMDASTETPTSWSWSFTGGSPSSSTAQNPTITYNTAGTYQVQLTATNANGSDMETKVGYITVNDCGSPPVVTSSQCGTTISSIKETIFFQAVANATSYEYRIIEDGTSNQFTASNGVYRISLASFGASIKFNTLYNLQARAFVNGAFTNYSPICQITTPAIAVPTVTSSQCGTTISSVNETIFFRAVANATSYEYRIIEDGTSNQFTATNELYRVNLASFGASIKFNTLYNLQARALVNGVFSNYTSICQITTPTAPAIAVPTVTSSQCGTTISSVNETIFFRAVANATSYEYRIIEDGTSNQFTATNGVYRINLASFGTSIKFNTLYNLQARALVNGVFSNYTPICQITTPTAPAIPVPTVTSSQCGTTISSVNETIFFQAVANATSYEYRIIEDGTSNQFTASNGLYRISLASFGAIELNTLYNLQARALVNGVFSSYTPICQITTPSSFTKTSEIPDDIILSDIVEQNETSSSLIIYPNPNQGQFLYLELAGINSNVQVMVTDISGKIMLRKELNTNSQYVSETLKFENKLSPGFYMINVISGDQRMAKKLIVK